MAGTYYAPEAPSLVDLKTRMDNVNKRVEKKDYLIHVVTHMVGGSSYSGKVEEEAPIKGASVRGHLRFWWRATRGTKYTTAKELFAQEKLIFGSSSEPAPVKIWVDSKKKASSPTAQMIVNSKGRLVSALCNELNSLSYVAFPFQDKKENNTYFPMQTGFTFTLNIQYEQQTKEGALSVEQLKEEMCAALWAWVNFGGIGARTRRGFGSLYCEIFSPNSKEASDNKAFIDWFYGKLRNNGILSNVTREWTTLGGIMVQRGYTNHLEAWKAGVATYQYFRRRATLRGGKPQGRSYWPEADAIRGMTKMSIKNHSEPFPPKQAQLAFPRSQFGMPIIFHFKDNKSNNHHGRDPYDSQLTPNNRDRLASPLVVKTIAVSKEQGYSAFIRLNQPQIREVKLEIIEKSGNEASIRIIRDRLRGRKIYHEAIYNNQKYDNNPLAHPDTNKVNSNAIEAFLVSKGVKEWQDAIGTPPSHKQTNKHPRQ
ncbi:type III-B CRISPR module RAMP protein Cmr1 [Paenibacillus sp. NPDC058071]|uniref:type III-B CRISPR module RAMP protein Cmr1 n=1 Tax=Paenibacillus sp. NPDC058071 TaxID=3346326 RepID=UPI0036DD7C87